MDRPAENIIVGILQRQLGLSDQNVWVRDQNKKIPNDDGLYIIVGMTDNQIYSAESTIKTIKVPRDSFDAGFDSGFGEDAQTGTAFDAGFDAGFAADPATVGGSFDSGFDSGFGDDPNYVFQTVEIQETSGRENIQIDMLSRTQAARTRRAEVVMALASIYSLQQQETAGFQIARLPQSFANTSSAEGGSNINRFTIIVPCLVCYKKQIILTAGDYYNDFTQRVDDEKTIGKAHGYIEFEIKGDS